VAGIVEGFAQSTNASVRVIGEYFQGKFARQKLETALSKTHHVHLFPPPSIAETDTDAFLVEYAVVPQTSGPRLALVMWRPSELQAQGNVKM